MRVFLAPLALLLFAGCMQDLPGERVGLFSLTGDLTRNGCGSQAVPAFESIAFEVDLRAEEGGAAYWVRPDAPTITGLARAADDSYEFGSNALVSTTTEGCVLLQGERVEVAVTVTMGEGDSDPDELQLAGENSVELSARSPAACLPLLAQSGGPFLALPCTLSYDISGAAPIPDVSSEP